MPGRGHYDEETGLVKVSWSKIRTHEECREKAQHIANGLKSTVSDTTMFVHGNVVDLLMRRWLGMDDPPRGWMAKHVDEVLDELEHSAKDKGDGVIRWKHTGHRQQVREFCFNCAMRLEELLRGMVMSHDYQPAVRFKTRMNIPGLEEGSTAKILLTGEMDLLVAEKPRPLPDITPDLNPVTIAMHDVAQRPRLHIWDLKATRDKDYWRKTVAQLVFYDIACWCMFGTTSLMAGLLQPMVDDHPYISFTPTEEDRTQMYTRIVTVAHQIMRGDAAPKEGSEGCSWCEVKHACSKYAREPGTNRIALF